MILRLVVVMLSGEYARDAAVTRDAVVCDAVARDARVVRDNPLTRASLNSFTVPHSPHSGQRPYHFEPLQPHSEHK